MIQALQKLKNKKGFTLVELIVVLVILAILAALLVPALTGYIDKANKEKIVAETRQLTMAAQSTLSEAYGQNKLKTDTAIDSGKYKTAIDTLAEIDGKGWTYIITVSTEAGKVGQVESVQLWDGTYGCVYYNGSYYVKGDTMPEGSELTVPTGELKTSIAWNKAAAGDNGQ